MSETNNDRIPATYRWHSHPIGNISIYLLFICISIYKINVNDWSSDDAIFLIVFLACIFVSIINIPWQIIKLLHPVYFTAEGLEFCRRNKVLVKLPWSYISQVGVHHIRSYVKFIRSRTYLQFHTIRYPVLPVKGLLITDLIHTTFFKVVRLDPSQKNIKTVRRFHGELSYKPDGIFVTDRTWR